MLAMFNAVMQVTGKASAPRWYVDYEYMLFIT